MAEQLSLTAATQRPLDMSHQGLAACLAVMVAAHTRFPADPTMLAILGDLLPHAHGDGVTAQALVQAGKRILAAHTGAAPDWRGWLQVDEAANYAVRLYYRQRAAHAHARIFPETQLPQTQEAHHAAE